LRFLLEIALQIFPFRLWAVGRGLPEEARMKRRASEQAEEPAETAAPVWARGKQVVAEESREGPEV
jgi:hypothetical protein